MEFEKRSDSAKVNSKVVGMTEFGGPLENAINAITQQFQRVRVLGVN
jgi:hypothetical protein